ncbi:hypothetical protein Trydic_g3109 [Trypoxylus dichotomus]
MTKIDSKRDPLYLYTIFSQTLHHKVDHRKGIIVCSMNEVRNVPRSPVSIKPKPPLYVGINEFANSSTRWDHDFRPRLVIWYIRIGKSPELHVIF